MHSDIINTSQEVWIPIRNRDMVNLPRLAYQSNKDETCTIIDKCNSVDKLLNGGLAVLNLNAVLLLIFIDTSDAMNFYLPSRNIIF
jgi:hypothetical protein